MPVPEECPNCGAEVPRHAKACPDCGSDESTGWSDAAETGDFGLADEEFDYESFVRGEFGGADRNARRKWVPIVAAVLLVVLVLFFLF